MIQNKRVDIRIDPETYDLLQSLCSRFNDTKSNIIRKAIKTLASKNKHYITLGFFDAAPSSKKEYDQDEKYKERKKTPEEIEKEKEEWKKLMKELDELGKK